MTSKKFIPGGFTTVRLVDEEVKKICIQVKQDMEKKAGTSFKDFIPLFYRSQVVAGTNYLVKVDVCQGNGEKEDVCVHAMIFQALPCEGGELTVTVQYSKLLTDPMVPF